jgi:thiol-disulfide isomerase/thioredoxin
MKRKILFFIIIGMLVGVIIAFFVYERSPIDSDMGENAPIFVERGSVSDNSSAPNFSLRDISGKMVNLDNYIGKVIIINFWATWCVPCKEEMPFLEEFSKKNSEDIVMIGIDIGDNVEDVKDFINEFHITYPILLDETGIVATAYHIVGYPTTYFIDATGIIRGKYVGLSTQRVFQQYLLPLGLNK